MGVRNVIEESVGLSFLARVSSYPKAHKFKSLQQPIDRIEHLQMNVPAVLNLFRVLRDPSLCLPHHTVANFNQLPVPLSNAFDARPWGRDVDIKAVVLDKDNCFARPGENTVYKPYAEKFKALVEAYAPDHILIVSNSTGTSSSDPSGVNADLLERNTGVKVLRHSAMKPACSDDILKHFKGHITSPSQIAIVGDRIFTDVVMANNMGAYSIWIRDGVVPDRGFVTRVEYGFSAFLQRRGFRPPTP